MKKITKTTLKKKVAQANRQLRETRNYYGKKGNRALRYVDQSLNMLSRKGQFKKSKIFRLPKNATQEYINMLDRAVDKAINSKYMSPEGREEIRKKSREAIASNLEIDDITEENQRTLDIIFDVFQDEIWSSVREQVHKGSDVIIDSVAELAEMGYEKNNVIDLLKEWNEGNKDVTLRQFIDEFIYNNEK